MRLGEVPTGEALISVLQASPYRDIDLAPARAPMPVRDVELSRAVVSRDVAEYRRARVAVHNPWIDAA